MSFPLHELLPAWYWLHIEQPPWTILSGTAAPPPGIPVPGKGTRGGFAYVQKGERRLLAASDGSGWLVNWTRIEKQSPGAQEEASMAWEAEVRLHRPGLKVKAKLFTQDILEYIPFEVPGKTIVRPYWGQTLAKTEVEILHGFKRSRLEGEAVLETMVTGG